MTQVVKTDYQVTESGKQLLSTLREHWGTEERIIEKSRVNQNGVPGIWPTVVVCDLPIKKLNQHLPAEMFKELGEYIKPEHFERFSQLIKVGQFEVEKALQVVKNAPKVVDVTFQPDDWQEAAQLNSPSFATFTKYRGMGASIVLIQAMIYELSEEFGRRSDITKDTALRIANKLLNKINTLTLAEFKLALNMLINQPQRISNLDSQTVTNFVKAFVAQKLDLAQRENDEKRASFAEPVHEITERYEKRKNRELRFDEVMKLYK